MFPTLTAYKDRLTRHVQGKLILASAMGMAVALVSLLLLFQYLYQQQLNHSANRMASQVQMLFQVALENAMLKRDLEGLNAIVQRLGQQAGIRSVMIINPDGEIRFSSQPERLYQPLAHKQEETTNHRQASTQFMKDWQQQPVLRSLHPVANREACLPCHGSVAENPINGVLLVDFEASPVEQNAWESTKILFYIGLAILTLSLFFAWLAARHLILRPLTQLNMLAKAIGQGRLQQRSHMQGKDELHQLGRTMDQMADNLSVTIQRLEEREAYTQSILDHIPDGIRVIDQHMRTQLTNQAFRDRLGLEDDAVELAPCHAVSHARTTPCPPTVISCPVHELIDTPGQRLKTMQTHIHADGQSEVEVEVVAASMEVQQEGTPKKLIVESIRDIKEAVAFAHGQKMAALGQLASGIAHEVRNPLAGIRFAMQSNLSGDEVSRAQLKETVELTEKAVDHCIEITERVLRLSEAPGIAALLELNTIVEETVALMNWQAREFNVVIHTELSEQNPRTMAADSDLRIVLLNLMQNALHAMPSGGTLRIGTTRGTERVAFVVEDTGEGIAPDIRAQIFDPFFSHRADGSHGAGLGLTLVQTTLSRYDGQLMLDSTPGKGSRFTISLTDADINSSAPVPHERR
ncbi:sensor histidine kinase [Magnetococcus sp. PR-3]|uniref:sensor histidine kinase n=1 Tax=Magnetococcus sp. PR-3 TaxID=3120355 RepID=UPI002FCE4470